MLLDLPRDGRLVSACLLDEPGGLLDLLPGLLEVLLFGFRAFNRGLELFAVVEMGFISVLHFFGVEVDLELEGVDFLVEELFALLRVLQFFGGVFAHQEEVFLLR